MFVYFMKCLSFIKIGSTTGNLYQYRTGMQVGNPFQINYVGLILCNSEEEMKKKERDLQEKFKHLNKRGEWFYVCQELENYVEEHAKNPDSYVKTAYEQQKSDRRKGKPSR